MRGLAVSVSSRASSSCTWASTDGRDREEERKVVDVAAALSLPGILGRMLIDFIFGPGEARVSVADARK